MSISRRRELLRASFGLCVLVLTAALAFGVYERDSVQRGLLEQVNLYTKVLEDQTTQAINSTDTVVRYVGESIDGETRLGGTDPIRFGRLLEDAVRGQTFVRSLSLVDARGRVLASSNPSHVDLVLDLAALTQGSTPLAPLSTRFARITPGRDLADLARPDGGHSAVHVLPLVRRLGLEGDAALYLVALVNPEHFATQFVRVVGEQPLTVSLLSFTGELITTTDLDKRLVPGHLMNKLPPFSQYLPRIEHTQYVGPGLKGDAVVAAFRVSRHWPLVLLVEQPASAIDQRVFNSLQWALGLTLLSWLAIGATTVLLWRGQKRDEAAHAELELLHARASASEARKQAIFQTSLDGIVTIDAQGRVVDFNTAAEAMFGRSRAEMMALPMHELIVPPAHRQAHVEGMARFFASGQGAVLNRRIEIEAMRSDGSLFPVELTIVPVQTGGEFLFTATVRDITERKHDERERKRAEAERNSLLQRYRELTNELRLQKVAVDEHAIITVTDAQGKVLYVNNRFLETTATHADEVLGRNIQTIIRSGGQEESVYEVLEFTLRTGQPWHGDLLYRRRDGGKRWLSSTIVPKMDGDGTLRNLMMVQTDITSLRLAEQALRESRSRELSIGGRIQQSLLVTPPDQRLPRTWLSVFSQASQGIDGDFVEVMPVGPDCVDIIAADVMGKGVGAALIGAGVKMQFSRSLALLVTAQLGSGELPGPARIVAEVHRAMVPSLLALDAFVTLCYVRIDTAANTVTWVGCGHEEPLLLTQGQSTVRHLANQHPPVGILETADYQADTLPMLAGDALFMCSDGLPDAISADGQRVGHERVAAAWLARQQLRHPPAAVLHGLRRDLLGPGVRFTDDLTMVVAQRTRSARRASRRELPIHLDSVVHVRGLVEHRALMAGLDEVAAGLLTVAAVEAFTNIVRHARGKLDGAPVELVVMVAPGEQVEVQFVYLGDYYEPPPEWVETNFADYPEGGFGLNIMREATDTLEFLHDQGVNTVRLVRRVEEAVPNAHQDTTV